MKELPPSEPLPLSHGVPGCALGLLGMFLYGLGLQIAAREIFARDYKISPDTGPILAGIGCALFCVAIALIWRLSMKTLVILVLLAGVMIWGVTTVREARDKNDRIRFNNDRRYERPVPSPNPPPGYIDNGDAIEPVPAQPAPAQPAPPKTSPPAR